MNRKIIITCMTSILFLATLSFSAYANTHSFLKNISPSESVALIENNKNNPEFKIIDVRTPAEFKAGHLQNADLLDFFSKSFAEEMNQLDKDKTYLIYCRSGNRSGKTLALMEKLGFRKVYNMSGGILGWNAERLPTVK